MKDSVLKTYDAVLLAFLLWLEGAKHALRMHRCCIYCVYDISIGRIMLKCLMLNGGIFFGSLVLFECLVKQMVPWLLQTVGVSSMEHGLRFFINASFYIFWAVPVYMVSFPLSSIWYQEIANLAVRLKPVVEARDRGMQGVPLLPPAPPPSPITLNAMAAETYRCLLFAVFFAQVSLAGLIPYAGPYLNFVMMAWLYALYCYDYKWSLRRRDLRVRIIAFQANWPFFLGYGSVCSVLLLFFSFFWGASLMATVYPFFVVLACDSDAVQACQAVTKRRSAVGRGATVPPLPIFHTAILATNFILHHGPGLLKLPGVLFSHRWRILGVSALVAVAASTPLVVSTYHCLSDSIA
eukprot:jgi/Botrbrau1/16246/Bobra.0066s0031.1